MAIKKFSPYLSFQKKLKSSYNGNAEALLPELELALSGKQRLLNLSLLRQETSEFLFPFQLFSIVSHKEKLGKLALTVIY